MRRSAFTLLEVILALAILTGALAVLGELVRSGLNSAKRARDLSRATLLCEEKLAQIATGMLPPEPVMGAVIQEEYSGEWLYSVEIEDTGLPTVLAVRVTVQRDQAAEKRPVTCSLVRWMRNTSAEMSTASSSSTSTTSSSSTSSSSGSSTGARQ